LGFYELAPPAGAGASHWPRCGCRERCRARHATASATATRHWHGPRSAKTATATATHAGNAATAEAAGTALQRCYKASAAIGGVVGGDHAAAAAAEPQRLGAVLTDRVLAGAYGATKLATDTTNVILHPAKKTAYVIQHASPATAHIADTRS
jgi:hypothetical protein